MNKAKIIKAAGMLCCVAFVGYKYHTRVSDDTLDETLRASMQPAPVTAVDEPSATPVIDASQAQANPVQKRLPFLVAPDANHMFDAAKMFANAINPELEKKWLGIRLQTQLAREYEAQSAANLKVQQNKLQRLKLAAQIKSYDKGNHSESTATLDTATVADHQQLYDEMAAISVVLQSYTAANGGHGAFVSLKVGSQTYERVRKNHFVGPFQLVGLSDDEKCVMLKFKSALLQNRCV